MFKLQNFKGAFFCLFLLTPFLANSSEISNARWYKVWGSGFYLGDLYIEFKESGGNINIWAYAGSRGIAKNISNYSSDSKSSLSIKDGKVLTNTFSTDFILRKRERNIDLFFAPDGSLKSEKNIPPEIRGKRPAVPKNLIDGSYDPLAAAMVVRERIKKLIASGDMDKISKKNPDKFVIPMYDGRRRSDLEIEILGRTETSIVNKNMKAIHLTAYNKPVSGFTKNEMRDMPDQNPKINVWVGDDELLLPIKGDGQTRVGFASGSLVKECRTMKECRD